MLDQVVAFVFACVRFVRRVLEHLSGVGLFRSAASLAFTTLLGLVPLFTVAFAYVARFPLFERTQDALESFLLRFFLPGSGAAVHDYLTEFVAKTADLKGVGILFVVLTAFLLVWQVESEINAIYDVRASRSLARRTFIILVGITAGPASIGAAVYFMTWLIDESSAVIPIESRVLAFFLQPVALAVETAVFTFMYGFVPAQRVRFRIALIGGILAAVVFEIAKWGFRFYIVHFPTYKEIYGTLAILPLFLLWIYLAWIIILAGAAVTATIAELSEDRARGA
jgi:membrane protein